jgi:hypothetical protein
MMMRVTAWCVSAALVFGVAAHAADFGSKGGPEPANIDEIAEILRKDAYDLELLISFGTSKGGSAGHLALAIRDQAPGDDLVYSANFYADRSPRHEKGFFGLDFGEIYKRSVVGVRVYGVPAAEKEGLSTFFKRINDDFHARASGTEYHRGEVRYDYLRLNCAKTIGAGFKYGAGYKDLEVASATILPAVTRVVAAANANIPTEMAMKLLKEWNARGYGLDVVLYKKYEGSTWVDPHDEEPVAFKNLPNRFPSVLSRDFRKEQGQYQDVDNLFAMYVLFNMGKYSVRVNGETKLLEIEASKSPMAYPEAARLATESAKSDSDKFRQRKPFRSSGTAIGEAADNTHLYNFTEDGSRKAAPGQPRQ